MVRPAAKLNNTQCTREPPPHPLSRNRSVKHAGDVDFESCYPRLLALCKPDCVDCGDTSVFLTPNSRTSVHFLNECSGTQLSVFKVAD